MTAVPAARAFTVSLQRARGTGEDGDPRRTGTAYEKHPPKREEKQPGRAGAVGFIPRTPRGGHRDQPSFLPSRWSSRRSLRSLPEAKADASRRPQRAPRRQLKELEGLKGSEQSDPSSTLPRLPSRTNPFPLFAGHFPSPKRCSDTRSGRRSRDRL